MKNLILVFVLLFSTYIFSQTERTINLQNLDKINEVQKLLDPVKYKTFTVFKIENINKFLYKVEISGKGFNLETPIPTELQTLFRLTPEEKTAITNNDKASVAAEDIRKENDVMEGIKGAISVKLLAGTKSVTTSEIRLKAKIDVLNIKCDEYYRKAGELTTKLFELKVLKIELINIAQMDASCATIQGKAEVSNSVPSPVTIYKDFIRLYTEVEILYDEAKKLTTADDENYKKIEEATEKLEKSFKVFKEENVLSLYSELTFLHNELNTDSNFIAQAPPIQMTGDFVEYKCKITPTKTNTYGAYKSPQSIDFIIPNYGGVKVDFSVGPTLSVGKGAKDEIYFLEQSTTADKSYLRQRNNNNVGIPGVAAMMHFYDRGAREVTFGGLFGAGAGFKSIEDVDLSFYLGVSAVLGKKQKVMLNSGICLQRVDRLKEKQFVVDSEYTTQGFEIDNVVEKVFRPSLFISLSYSLAKRVTD